MNVRQRLKDLVVLASTEHDDPAPILDYVRTAGRDLGAKVVLVKNGTRPAILLRWGKPRLLLSGHLDTVPRSGTWKAKTGTVRGGRMYGRGTTDMKGGCAAMLVAAERGKDVGGFGILFTTDEETHMEGAAAAIARGLLADTEHVIVGEPTSLRPNLAQKGILQLRLLTAGKSGHASMPWAGDNAIAAMGRLLTALEPLSGAKAARGVDMTASPNLVEGGVAMNVIADHCALGLDVRYAPLLGEKAARKRIEQALDATKIPYRLEVVQRIPPAGPRREHRLGAHLRKSTRETFGLCDFSTEAALFAAAGADFVVVGPGEPEHCHVTDESVELAQVERAVEIYAGAITTLS